MIMNTTTILSIAGAALGFLGLVSALIACRSIRGWRQRCLGVEANLAALRRELEVVTSISSKAGQRTLRLEQECSGVAFRVDQLELRTVARSFDRAIDSARRGADPGKLAQLFGLSRGEADLVSRLHGRKKIA